MSVCDFAGITITRGINMQRKGAKIFLIILFVDDFLWKRFHDFNKNNGISQYQSIKTWLEAQD